MKRELHVRICESLRGKFPRATRPQYTYLLLAIYCHENHGEPVNIKRVRELRLQIQNELRSSEKWDPDAKIFKEQKQQRLQAKT